jgi:hypothetical protein
LLIGLVLAACGSSPKPQLTVLGIEQSTKVHEGRRIKLFVEVVNHAKRPMRLQRLRYSFGPGGEASARGEVNLSRTVEAGSAIVVEVPITVDTSDLSAGDLELRGQLVTEQDQIVRTYSVSAEVADEAATSAGIVIHSPGE